MDGTYVQIYGLTFESALKICTAFDEYDILNKKKSFFRDGEVSLELKKGFYRITAVEEFVCIEEIIQVINESGKLEWKVTNKVTVKRDSFSSIVIK